jgi:hypothetical protein
MVFLWEQYYLKGKLSKGCLGRWKMKKYFACLGLVFLVVTAFAIAPAGAVPKLAGNWVITGKDVMPNQPTNPLGNINMTMTITATTDPTLFYGIMHGGNPDPQYITIMMDAGANMHFAISWPDEQLPNNIHAHAWGQGTASGSKVVGSFVDDLGNCGKITATPAP